MDWKSLLEVASPVTILFVAGMLYQEIRTFRRDLADFAKMREAWSGVMVRIGTLENVTAKLSGGVRELRTKLGDTREELASFHSE